MTEPGGCVHRPPGGGIASDPAFIDKLQDVSPDRVGDLLVDSEAAGSRIVRRLMDEWADGTNRFERPGESLFAAWVVGRLVGVCGLNVDPYAGDDRIGRVRHLYVLNAARRLGVGRALMAEIVGAARGRFGTLRLSTSNPAAARLYESLGFLPMTADHCTHLMTLPRA